MRIEKIPHAVCPSCKSHVVAESCRHRHCNGQGFEEREFACGSVWAWSPNAERLEIRKPCPSLKEEIEKKRKREAGVVSLRNAIKSLDADDEWKEHMLEQFRYMEPREWRY